MLDKKNSAIGISKSEALTFKTRLRHIKEKWKASDFSAYIFILPAMIIVSMFIIYPAIWSLVASFRNINPMELRDSGLFEVVGEWIAFDNYIDVLGNQLFRKSLFNTIYFAAIFIPLTMFASVTIAMLLDKGIKGSAVLRSIFFIPYVISIVSASLVFMIIFGGNTGLVNAVLALFGIESISFLSETAWAMPVIALMSSWRRVGYFMLIYLAALQNIPKSLYEASDIDGATSMHKFRYITWPMLGRINMVVFILLMIFSFNIFQEVFVMTGGGPADSTITVPFLIYNEAFTFYDMGSAAAMSYILFAVVVFVGVVQHRINKNKLDY
ncbi:MAG: sugar ABC transporter permease [Clostridiales bacterium]|nr:sugar ABC transporter permease [Clostridiales bacterium]